MTRPWIRVDAALADRPVVHRAAEALRISPAAAVGYLVNLWGAVSRNGEGGRVAHLPDQQLEFWARWPGRRGAFARWVRSAHVDEDGVIRDWAEFQGQLEERRRQQRVLIAGKRRDGRTPPAVAQHDADGTPTVAQQARNGTRSVADLSRANGDGTKTKGAAAPWMGEVRRVWRERFDADPPAQAAKQLRELVEQHGVEEVIARLATYLAAVDGKFVSLPRFASTYGEHRTHAPDGPPLFTPEEVAAYGE